MDDRDRQLRVFLPPAMHAFLKEQAKSEGCNINDLLRGAVREKYPETRGMLSTMERMALDRA